MADDVDIDDDNDGILDVIEGFSPLTSVNTAVAGQAVDPGFIPTASSAQPNPPIRYLDASYVHPVFGVFQDVNNDGVNDIFDTDRDGIPNQFDLDSDGDGLPDAFEANNNVNPTAKFAKTVSSGANGYLVKSAYDATQGKYVGTIKLQTTNADISNTTGVRNAGIGPGVGANGLPDAVEKTLVTYGGNSNSPTVTEAASPTSKYVLKDNDADQKVVGVKTSRNFNFLDLDSDNDGITDELEAQTTAAYTARKGRADFNADANKNGIRDAYDLSAGTGGTAIGAPVNSGGTAAPDMFDFDSDGDNAGKGALAINKQTADWTEGFDDNQNGTAGEELVAKAQAFALANPSKASYYAIGSPNKVADSGFLQDSDGDKIPNFLDLNSSYYHDDNFNGLVDLYDPAYGGTPSKAPLVGAAGTEAIFRSTLKAVPLPVTLVNFQAQAVGRDALVSWATAQEMNSASFVVERSTDGISFVAVATLPAQGNSTQRNDYHTIDKNAGAEPGLRYYRLLQLDRDGSVARSEVRVVRFDVKGGATTVLLYPNPASTDVTLDLAQLPTGAYRVEVLSADGRKVAEWTASGGQQQVLPMQNFAKGVYLLRISGQQTTQVLKMVKE